jgi:hypothetical protein
VQVEFDAEVWEWRGPAPFHFVSVPEHMVPAVADASQLVSYGWGMVPAQFRIGRTDFTTAMWPRDGGYAIPLKTAVRKAEGIELGDTVHVVLRVGP